MQIKIDETHFLSADKYNFIVHKGIINGKQKEPSYFTNIICALEYIIECQLKQSKATHIIDLFKEVIELRLEYIRKLDQVMQTPAYAKMLKEAQMYNLTRKF